MLTPDLVAIATRCPQRNVAAHWPNVLAALVESGISALPVQIAAAATIAVETGSFLPIRERRADKVRQLAIWTAQERYWHTGFYGRGFIQLTWRGNYLDAGEALNLDLVGNPDLALEPVTAARILALFLKIRGVPAVAEVGNWRKVRRLVNGGTYGMERFLTLVQALEGKSHD